MFRQLSIVGVGRGLQTRAKISTQLSEWMDCLAIRICMPGSLITIKN